MSEIQVFLLAQCGFFRQGVRFSLSSDHDIRLMGDSGDLKEALPCLSSLSRYGVILYELPSYDGVEPLRQIKRNMPDAVVIALADNGDLDARSRAIEAGATAVLSKQMEAQELAGAIRMISGRDCMSTHKPLGEPEARSGAGGACRAVSVRNRGGAKRQSPLSRRGKQVLTYTAQGYSNRQIASTLSISEQTVKNHMSAIFSKLNTRKRTYAAILALRNGWISMQGETETSSVVRRRPAVAAH